MITSSGSYFSGLSKIQVKCDGDGFCNIPIENALNCPQDCPTGIKDNVCDAAKYNRVDPDCEEGVDPDDTAIYEQKIGEMHRKSNTLVYVFIIVSIIILVGIFVGFYRIVKRIKK